MQKAPALDASRRSKVSSCRSLAAILLACACLPGSAQEPERDANLFYRFPFSLGFEYESLSPFAEYGSHYNIFDLSFDFRLPIPRLPVIQPVAEIGMMRFDNQEPAEEQWDHIHWYGALGAVYAHRFIKHFEIGAEALVGFSSALFPDLLPEVGTVSAANLLMELGARISLNPSYSLNIDVHPSLKWLVALNPLKDYNGLIFGIGFSASYRFGQDPDAPTAVIRSIDFQEARVPDLFAALQSYYVKHPIGSVRLTNVERHSVTDVEVSFFQAGYMDSPTPVASIAELAAGESRQIDLVASFNKAVFGVQGITPLTGDVVVTYRSSGWPAEQKHTVAYDLYDKTALTWDDDRKVAAYITPADSALRNYTSFIRQACKEQVIPTYNGPLQDAMQIYEALCVLGCLYQPDPSMPFSRASGDPQLVDSVSLPRDTLSRITGDCDDLTVLFASLLETVGVKTGFITVPGHIYAAFDTEVPVRDFGELFPDRDAVISFEGTLWVPVEITLIGRSGFLDAWRKGAEEWHALDGSPEKRVLYRTREAQELYRAVGLTESDLGLQYGSPEAIAESFSRQRDELVEGIVGDCAARAKGSNDRRDHNRLGIAYARLGFHEKAEEAFREALRLDPGYQAARINLGSLFYLQGRYDDALEAYGQALDSLRAGGLGDSTKAMNVLINISKTYYQMGDFAAADEYFERARAIDEEAAESFSYLAHASDGTIRASEAAMTQSQVIFAADEE